MLQNAQTIGSTSCTLYENRLFALLEDGVNNEGYWGCLGAQCEADYSRAAKVLAEKYLAFYVDLHFSRGRF